MLKEKDLSCWLFVATTLHKHRATYRTDAHKNDEKSFKYTSHSHDPGQTDKENNAKNVLNAWEVHTHNRT